MKSGLASIFLLGVFLMPLTPSAAAYSNREAIKAYDLFEEGQEEYREAMRSGNSRKLASAEKTLLRARGEVSRDTDALRFTRTETRLIPGSGRWPKYEEVVVESKLKYFPNRLIQQIRSQRPPRPLVLASLQRSGPSYDLVVEVKNGGESALEGLRVRCGTHSESFSDLPAGGSDRLVLISGLSEKDLRGRTLSFSEKYGFVPCRMKLSGD